MKRFLKVISIIFVAVFSINFLIACNGATDTSLSNEEIVAEENYQGRGVHEATVSKTSGYFIRNGETDYSLVVPKEAKKYELEAAEYINQYTALSAGTTYPIITDDQVQKGGKYISLGETTLLHESGISIPFADFGNSGFRVLTKDGVLYLAGARSALRKGTLFAAQEFLKYTVGYHAYALDEVKYETLSLIKALNFDIVEIPEFDERRYGAYNITKSTPYVNMLRLDIRNEGQLPFAGHSHFTVLPPEVYFEDHSDWYWHKTEGATKYDSLDDMYKNGQLCLSNEEMVDEFCAQLIQWFRDYPEANFAHLGMMDSITGCECTNCKAKMARYNTNLSGINMMFMNEVSRRVTEEIQKTEPDRILYFETFAYYTTLEPCATKTNGVWKEHCLEAIPDWNIFIQFAPLGYNTSEILTAQANEKYAEYLEGWKYLVEINGAQLSCWNYGTNYNWMQINHKNWDIVTYNFRFYSENGVTRMYDQSYNLFNIGCCFVEMRAYVESMLMWDLSLNYQDLAEDFIANYYGPAATQIQRSFDVMTTYYEQLRADGLSGNHKLDIGVNTNNRWSFAYVETQRKLYESAYQAIEPLKESNPEEYDKYYLRVSAAYMENIFMQLDFYMDRYSKDHVAEMIDLFEWTAGQYGMTWLQEGTRTVETYLTQWRGSNV